MDFEIEVNNKSIRARKGETILEALTRHGINVPTLCHMDDLYPTGSCRMCVVEVEGKTNLIPACSYPVEEWMKIRTHSPRVVSARKTIVELLLSNHPDDCLYCERNGNCELQKFAEELDVRERRFPGKKNKYKTDPSSASIIRDPAKCILCGRCIRVCEEIQHVTALDFIGKGNKMLVGPAFNKGLNLSSCINCGQCIMACPTGALTEKRHFAEIQDALHKPNLHVVIQTSPTMSVTLAEEFGIKTGKDINGIMNAALRKLGFHKVFDSSFAADVVVMEESAELLNRIKNNETLPMFTSCCPGWIKYIEQFRPEFIPNLSTCKSPQQMLGALIRNYYAIQNNIATENIYSVSAMPCIAKKFEGQREQMTHKGITDVDAVLTTRELARLIRLNGIDINHSDPEHADMPFQARSSAGKLFAISGGTIEAILRTFYFRCTGKEMQHFKLNDVKGNKWRKEGKIKIGDLSLGIAVVNGLGAAGELLDEIAAGRTDLHFVEVMVCQGGCVNGGGQPIPKEPATVKVRTKTVLEIDEKESIKVAHKNPAIIDLYDRFLKEPLSKEAIELLHTSYSKREVLL
jgi:iron-only hydrogenase group A